MDEYLDKYLELFDDKFPMFQVATGRSDEEIIEIIQECISKGKDAYQLGYVEEDTVY